jgi:hypothetical protein
VPKGEAGSNTQIFKDTSDKQADSDEGDHPAKPIEHSAVYYGKRHWGQNMQSDYCEQCNFAGKYL